MQVIPEKRKVVLNTAKHKEIVDAIPHAKVFNHEGRIYTALQHGVEESLVLKNLGVKKVPPPILSYYTWPARFKAMEHQKLTAAFFTMNRKALCLNAPGTGKSIAALWAADFLIQEKLARKVLIVAPLSTLKVVWGKEIRHHLSHRSFELLIGTREVRLRKLATPGVHFFIVNHDGFAVIQDALEEIDVVIYDECFVAGTSVSIPSGVRAIESLKKGDEVLTSSGVQRVKRLIRRTSYTTITVEFEDGTKTTCTPEHPFFTDRGWLAAKDIGGRRVISQTGMPYLRSGLFIPEIEKTVGGEDWEAIRHDLLHILQVEENKCNESDDRDVVDNQRVPTKIVENIPSRKTYTESGISSKNISHTQSERLQTCSARRKWNWSNATRDANYRSNQGTRSCVELHDKIGSEASRLSKLLQSRFCDSRKENMRGSGWKQPYNDRTKTPRQKERSTIVGTRVARITYNKSRDGITVYNLEITGTPNYFADGHLVHNCTAIKSPSSQRFKRFFRWMAERNAWLWMLTGTPISQSPVDAWTLARLVGNPHVSKSFTAFKDMVMTKVSTFRWIPRASAIDVCQKVLQPSIRFSLDECNELPDTVFLDHECPMTAEQIKAFREMKERAVLLSHDVSAPNMAVMLSKLLQICCVEKDTPVLTSVGWKPIQSVTARDLLWDGEEWVNCSGSVCNGYKSVIRCGGVSMTPDHLVLATRGWTMAQEISDGDASKGFNRVEVRLPDCAESGRLDSWQSRVHNFAYAGEGGQRRSILPAKLSVGDCVGAGEQPAGKRTDTDPHGRDDHSRSGEGIWTEVDNNTQALGARQYGPASPSNVEVYDILNCGSRNRFVVRGSHGELSIVHNCGVCYGNEGDRVKLDFAGRYDMLKDVIDEIGDKVIVFVPFRGVQDRLYEMLLKDGYDVATVHGDIVGTARDKIFETFQSSDKIKVLLAHPKVAAHGLTLTRAKDIIWYAPIYSLESYEQANARIRRIGTEGKTRVHHLYSTSFEAELYTRLKTKQRVLADFLKLVRGVNEE